MPSLAKPAGRLTICWLPEIHAIAAVSSELDAQGGDERRDPGPGDHQPGEDADRRARQPATATIATGIGRCTDQQPGDHDRAQPHLRADRQVDHPGRDGHDQADRDQAGDRLVGQQRPPGAGGQERVGHPQREHDDHDRQQVQRRRCCGTPPPAATAPTRPAQRLATAGRAARAPHGPSAAGHRCYPSTLLGCWSPAGGHRLTRRARRRRVQVQLVADQPGLGQLLARDLTDHSAVLEDQHPVAQRDEFLGVRRAQQHAGPVARAARISS